MPSQFNLRRALLGIGSASGTSVTLNDSLPTADRYNMTIVEVLPALAPTINISGTVSPVGPGAGVLLSLAGPTNATTTADASGNYAFNGVAGGSYTVTPSKVGFDFNPPSQSVTVSGASVANVNFVATPVLTYSVSGNVGVGANGAGALVYIQGREVFASPERQYGAGRWSLGWDGRTAEGTAAMGVYLARVRVGEQQFVRRLAIVR